MKKLILFIIVFLTFPHMINAKITINGTGTNVNLGGSSSESLGEYEYFLRSDYYGIRISFYSEDGKKLGKTVDVYDYRYNYGQKLNSGFDKVVSKDKYARYHGKTDDGSLKSRIDYINEYKRYIGSGKEFFTTETEEEYEKYYDRGSLDFSTVVEGMTVKTTCKNKKCVSETSNNGTTLDAGRVYNNDPLKYLAYSNRIFFKSYFTTESTIKRYAELTGADIDTTLGNYYILIEPVFYISSLNCNNNCGFYSATEIGLIYNRNNKNFQKFLGKTNRENIFEKSFRLEESGEIGNYVFSATTSSLSTSELTDMSFLEKGYGMTIISGKEVCKENCKHGHYQIIYRTIGLDNPFVDVNGNIRTLSQDSNWYNRKSVIDKYVYDGEPYLTVVLTSSSIKSIRKDNKNIDYSSLNKETYNAFYRKYHSIFQ